MWLRFNSALYPKPLAGDWCVIAAGCVAVFLSFKLLWSHTPANRLEVRQGNQVLGIYDLNQTRSLHVHGPLGVSEVMIENGKVRFRQSPCNNQYCVHQGWLRHAGQAAICLPNQVALELLGTVKPYDSLNY